MKFIFYLLIIFSVLIFTAEECSENKVIISAVLAPNPASDVSNITFELLEPSDITISIFDINGTIVKQDIASGNYPTGKSNVSIQLFDLISGTYVVVLSNGKETKNVKLIITK